MTKAEALYRFWNDFGISAYPNTAVPESAKFPYITYEVSLGIKGDSNNAVIQLWYHTESEAVPNAKAEEIAFELKDGGCVVPYDSGYIWIKAGTPFCLNTNAEGDNSIKVRQINIIYDFL